MINGIGYNGGLMFEGGYSWCKYSWIKVCKVLIFILLVEVVCFRVKCVVEFGLFYKIYVGVWVVMGYDLIGFLFLLNVLWLLCNEMLDLCE